MAARVPHTQALGSTLRRARRDRELKQADVAKRAGTSDSYLSKIESGRCDIRVELLLRLVEDGLRMDLAHFITLYLRRRDGDPLTATT
jgi:transcriptional regulator with XRE-family HTH domain